MTKRQAIQIFREQKVRTVWDDETEEWYFSVVDVVAVLTDSNDPKQYEKKLKARDLQLKSNWGTICTQVQMLSADGKRHKENAAKINGILRIIQSIPSPKAEPFKLWMAQVAAERLAKQYKQLKGLHKENLRDNMTNVELLLNALAEASTTELSKKENPDGYTEQVGVAKRGGSVAKAARKQLESQLGHTVVTSLNAQEYMKSIEQE